MIKYLVEITFRCSASLCVCGRNEPPRKRQQEFEDAVSLRRTCIQAAWLRRQMARWCCYPDRQRHPQDVAASLAGASVTLVIVATESRAGPVKSVAGHVRTLRASLRATGRLRSVAASPQVKWRSVATGSDAASARSYCP